MAVKIRFVNDIYISSQGPSVQLSTTISAQALHPDG
jgi:hypothetical protein